MSVHRPPPLLLMVLLWVGLSAGGCALHSPMSRTLMFHDSATEPSHRTNHGVGIVGTGTLTSTQFMREEAHRRFSKSEAVTTNVDPVNIDNRSASLYASYYTDHGVAFSASLGLPSSLGTAVGIDGTWQVWNRNYLTMSASPGGAQMFVSHRTVNSPHLGIAVGAGYRYERKFFDVENYFEGETPSPDLSVLPVHSSGGAVSVVLRPRSDAPGVLLGRLYVGYAPTYRRPVITFGITTGIF